MDWEENKKEEENKEVKQKLLIGRKTKSGKTKNVKIKEKGGWGAGVSNSAKLEF